MRNKKLYSNLTDGNDLDSDKICPLRKPSQDLVDYYKNKASRLEKDLDSLTGLLDNIKSVCDLSGELQSELSVRNEEVSRLQQVISDLQIQLYREKEHSLKVSAENDKLKIQALEHKKKINALLMLTGLPKNEVVHLLSASYKGVLVEKKLPPKIQKLNELKAKTVLSSKDPDKTSVNGSDEVDQQILILKNHSLAAQLEHHICISRDQIQVLLEERELALEERNIERMRLQKEIDLLATKLKESQDKLCETTTKLVKCQQKFEKERNMWVEEKDRYMRAVNVCRDGSGDGQFSGVVGYAVSGAGCKKNRSIIEAELMREQIREKEQLALSYQEQIIAMEGEINRMRERAELCRKTFKEKMEKMTAQTTYLKNKYEDLDRRRQLEAEGFRTDIKMLRERLKELEKKLTKANISSGAVASTEQQLLVSARNTLDRARQLEKELSCMKSKMSVLKLNDG